jgi:ATP-binding cassette subfamily B protein
MGMIFRVNPPELVIILTVTLVGGLAPSISLWLNKLLIDEVSRILAENIIFEPVSLILQQPLLFGVILGLIILSLVTDALSTIANFIFSSLRDRLQGYSEEIILTKVSNFPDIELFENPQLLNLVELTEKSKTSLKELAFITMTSLRGIFILIPSLILAGIIAPWLPIFLCITIFPSVYIDLIYRKKTWTIETSQALQVREMKLYHRVLIDKEYAKDIRLFGLQNFFLIRWKHLFNSNFLSLQHNRYRGTSLTILWAFFSGLGIILPYIYIIIQALQRRLTLGDLALYAGLILQVRRSLFSLLNDTLDLYQIILEIRPLFQVLDLPPKILPEPSTNTLDHTGIRIENLSFTYPNSQDRIFNNLNLEIKPQEIIAIVGENGAGKTTLAKLLCRFYDPTEGKILWQGKNLKQIPLNELRSRISTVMQDCTIFPASLRENIAFGSQYLQEDKLAIKLALAAVGLAEFTESLTEGIDSLLGKELEGGVELSVGQKQKLAIARGLVRLATTELLILDEPTASIDPNTEYEIYEIFRQILENKIVLIITHRLALCHLADRIIVLEGGEIQEQGTQEELLKREGKYYQMYMRQASGYLK